MSVLLDIDPLTDAIETMQYDHSTGQLQITRSENVDAILDANTASYNDSGQAWRGDDNDFWHAARIPLTTLFEWLQDFNKGRPSECRLRDPFSTHEEWDRFVFGRLNSSEYRKLMTAPIHV